MSTELVVTYSSLGTREDDDYYKGEECHACVKDLIRALRSDDEYCSVRRALGKARVLQTDLLPLLIHHHDDVSLRNDVIRLLVNLTQPAVLCFKEMKERKDSEIMKSYLEVVKCLQDYKEEFTDTKLMNVLGNVLADLCQKEWQDREDDDIIIIERILLMIRNILHITSDPEKEKRTDDDVSVHDQVILNLHKNGIDELLLFLGSNPNETEWCMHVLEILFLLLKEQSPYRLVQCGHRPLEEQEKDERMIDELLMKENMKKTKAQSSKGARHSRFGGSFYVIPKLSGQTRVHHKPLAGVDDYSFDSEKKPLRTHKTRKPAESPPKSRHSTYSIRMVLKEFCVQVLDCCFNPMMKVVKDTIKRQRSLENDETYYLWALRFFMEFSRLNDFRVDIVSEALQLSTVHDVIQLIAKYYEHLFMNKRDRTEALNWSQRLHYGVSAYKELLLHIREMTRSKDSVIAESSKVILHNTLYGSEYRDVFVMLLRNYREPFQPVTFIQDVIMMTHVYLQLMEGYCRKVGKIIVQKKRKVRKKKNAPQSSELGEVLTEEAKISRWEEIKGEVAAGVSECVSCDVEPYGVSQERSMEEQRLEVMGRIYGCLCRVDVFNAMTLLRSAREVWPDDCFGSEGATSEEEVQCLHELFLNPFSMTLATRSLDEEQLEEEEYETEPRMQDYELEFDFNKFISLFTNNRIVSVYCLALSTYSTNSEDLNHAVVKMLHRIAVKQKMAPMLYHISFFKTMLSILEEPPVPRYKELRQFCCYIFNGFLTMCQTNPVTFVELLFWKTSAECYELTYGYGTIQRERELTKNRTIFTREQEEELAELFEKFKNENDIVGCIEAALLPELKRTRRIIASQLVSQGLVSTRKELSKKTRKKKEWTEEEIFTLQSLWQPGEDIEQSVKDLLEYFPEHGINSIKKQLQALGLLPKKSGKDRKKAQDDDLLLSSDDSENDDTQELEGNFSHETVPELPVTSSGTKGDIDKIVHRLLRKGHLDELEWLKDYLIGEAEDRELDSEWEELCLVPVQEKVSVALQMQMFKDLLVSLGLTPPAGNQMYWRISKTITPQHLKDVAEKLTSDHVSDVISEDEDTSASVGSYRMNEDRCAYQNGSNSDNEGLSRGEILAKLQAKRKGIKRKQVDNGDPTDVQQLGQTDSSEVKDCSIQNNDDEQDFPLVERRGKKRKQKEDENEGTSEPSRKRQSHFLSDHSDESDAESSILTPVDDQSCASTQKQASSKSSRRRFLDDSSSDED